MLMYMRSSNQFTLVHEQQKGCSEIANAWDYPWLEQQRGNDQFPHRLESMAQKREKRAFRLFVWGSRAIGWILIALAVGSSLQMGVVTHSSATFRLLSSLTLGVVGMAWIIGLEVFLRFFDKFLSHN
jgi:hypothetical protein